MPIIVWTQMAERAFSRRDTGIPVECGYPLHYAAATGAQIWNNMSALVPLEEC